MNKDFATVKREKLARLPLLRVASALGMVAWRPDSYEIAKQHLRMLHPLSWIWLCVMLIYAVLAQGIPRTISDFRELMVKEMVLW